MDNISFPDTLQNKSCAFKFPSPQFTSEMDITPLFCMFKSITRRSKCAAEKIMCISNIQLNETRSNPTCKAYSPNLAICLSVIEITVLFKTGGENFFSSRNLNPHKMGFNALNLCAVLILKINGINCNCLQSYDRRWNSPGDSKQSHLKYSCSKPTHLLKWWGCDVSDFKMSVIPARVTTQYLWVGVFHHSQGDQTGANYSTRPSRTGFWLSQGFEEKSGCLFLPWGAK